MKSSDIPGYAILIPEIIFKLPFLFVQPVLFDNTTRDLTINTDDDMCRRVCTTQHLTGVLDLRSRTVYYQSFVVTNVNYSQNTMLFRVDLVSLTKK